MRTRVSLWHTPNCVKEVLPKHYAALFVDLQSLHVRVAMGNMSHDKSFVSEQRDTFWPYDLVANSLGRFYYSSRWLVYSDVAMLGKPYCCTKHACLLLVLQTKHESCTLVACDCFLRFLFLVGCLLSLSQVTFSVSQACKLINTSTVL